LKPIRIRIIHTSGAVTTIDYETSLSAEKVLQEIVDQMQRLDLVVLPNSVVQVRYIEVVTVEDKAF